MLALLGAYHILHVSKQRVKREINIYNALFYTILFFLPFSAKITFVCRLLLSNQQWILYMKTKQFKCKPLRFIDSHGNIVSLEDGFF
jgi:hypothetical protein